MSRSDELVFAPLLCFSAVFVNAFRFLSMDFKLQYPRVSLAVWSTVMRACVHVAWLLWCLLLGVCRTRVLLDFR